MPDELNLGSSGNAAPMSRATSFRPLNTPFVISTQRPVLVAYTYRVEVAGDEVGGVELRSDGANPPLTVRSKQTIGVGGAASECTVSMVALVFPGNFVEIAEVGTTLAVTPIAAVEVTL